MTEQNNRGDQRVTNATLRKDIQHLTELFEDQREQDRLWRAQQKLWQEAIEARMRNTELYGTRCLTRWDSHVGDGGTHEKLDGRLNEMHSDIKKYGGVFGFLGAAVATFIAFVKDAL